jgi:hypothetical protein
MADAVSMAERARVRRVASETEIIASLRTIEAAFATPLLS